MAARPANGNRYQIGEKDVLRSRRPTTYAEQTYASPSKFVRHAHQKRLGVVARLSMRTKPDTFLDWGAGDGFFAQYLLQADPGFARRFLGLYDPVPFMLDQVRERFAAAADSGRVRIYPSLDDLQTDLEVQSCPLDLIACLEVLEHMPLPERETFYAFCRRHLRPTGVCLVEVPVEIGVSILIKEFGRVFLKGRTALYTPIELIRATLGLVRKDPERYAPGSTTTWVQDHKGFDYRRLREEMEGTFVVREVVRSPLGFLPPFLGSQCVVYVLRRRDAAAPEKG